ncbi:MAG: photosynthetic reaction center cytochrome c subunit family protein [Acidobacteriota bacterium]
MGFGSKRLVATAAALTVAWVTSIAFALGGTTLSAQTSAASVAASTPAKAPATVPARPARTALPQAPAPAAAKPAAPTGEMSEQIFKNIQVLKGIPVDEFMGTMGVFTTSLSLCCSNCHTGAGTSNPKWEDDPPRKKTARRMIEMVQTINKTHFGGRQVVTCWTCHRGQLSPAVTAPLDFAYGEAVVVLPDLLPRATTGGSTLDEIFSKYITALGGQARLDALTSYTAKGKSLLFVEVGDGNPAEIFAKADGHVTTFVHQQEGDVVRAFDGTNAWWQIPLTVTPQYKLNATLLEGAKFDAAMAFPWKIRNFFGANGWRVAYPTTIDGTEVDVIQGNTPAGMIGTLYFDKKTGLLKRYIRYAKTMVGRIPTQVDYADYRPVAGVMMPFKYSYAWVSERDDWTMTSYEPNVAIDAAKFGRPDPKTAGDPNGRK